MGLMIPSKVELLYSINPDVIKPHIEVAGKLAQLVKSEALSRVEQGEALTFRLSPGGLFAIDVTPSAQTVPSLGTTGNLEFVVRRKEPHPSQTALVKDIEPFLLAEESYPSEVWRHRYDALIGLREIKRRVLTSLLLLFSDEFAATWSSKHHCQTQALALLHERYPVFIFAGEPGLGKTELACAIGDPLARALGGEVLSYRVGLQLRGGGLVGELSQNICKLIAFARHRHQERGVPVLILIDEADAIGHARDNPQQHHEESVGVNTLLQQIDSLRDTPGVGLIFTTNRYQALDTALTARSKANFVCFPLPSYGDRFYLLTRLLGETITNRDMRTLAKDTAGFSPRDLVQLVVASLIEAISRDRPLTAGHLLRAASLLTPSQLARSNGSGLTRMKSGKNGGRS